jgi:WXXGXW repeat (2 copies)
LGACSTCHRFEVSFLAQTSTSPKCEGCIRNVRGRSLAASSGNVPFNPRNPQQRQRYRAGEGWSGREKQMRLISSIRSPLFALVMLAASAASFAQIGISISIAPPPMPVYEQPLCPGDGYLWTPGYWAYADDGYYWVPGTWVMAPQVGFLWTPGYWGWGGGGYAFNEGYWGPRVGFYGGINYGFGYFGNGYEGGRWDHDHFYYNRSVNNVNITNIHNVYNTTIINNNTNRVSYNGGRGGIDRRATPQEETISHERHVPPVAAQNEHMQAARSNPEQRASVNHGNPAIAATPKPGEFNRGGAAKETETPNRAETPRPENSETARPENTVDHPAKVVHPKDLPARQPFTPPNTGNAKQDQKIQQQQQKMVAKQDQQHQQLQQKQDQDHQRQAHQNANEAATQHLEQQHQQQTQKLEQKHTQQEQKLQGKAQPANHEHASTLK